MTSGSSKWKSGAWAMERGGSGPWSDSPSIYVPGDTPWEGHHFFSIPWENGPNWCQQTGLGAKIYKNNKGRKRHRMKAMPAQPGMFFNGRLVFVFQRFVYFCSDPGLYISHMQGSFLRSPSLTSLFSFSPLHINIAQMKGKGERRKFNEDDTCTMIWSRVM